MSPPPTKYYENGAELRTAVERRVEYRLTPEDWGKVDPDGWSDGQAAYGHEDYIDLLGLVRSYLRSHGLDVDPYQSKLNKTLMSRRWHQAVWIARQRLGLPPDGISDDEARGLHDALLWALTKSTHTESDSQTHRVFRFWAAAVWETKELLGLLKIDRATIDRVWETFYCGEVNPLIGFRKLLNPEGVFRLAGHPIDYEASPTDRVMAYLLWGYPVSADELEAGPKIGFGWERMADGSGRVYEYAFDIEKATPRELRKMMTSLRGSKRAFRHRALASFKRVGTWEESWRLWNRRFPDMKRRSSEALRKAVEYARRTE